MEFENPSVLPDVSKGYLYKKISVDDKKSPVDFIVRTEVDAYYKTKKD
jgi:hypothetical protein